MGLEFEVLKKPGRVYLDHNATTPLYEGVNSKLLSWASEWGNPSSTHQSGRGPKQLLRESRQSVSQLIGASPLEVIFTGSGSEANNLAIKGALGSVQKASPERDEIIISSTEHPSVYKAAEAAKDLGYSVLIAPVLPTGLIDVEAFKDLLSPKTAFVSVMYANNETGVINPIKDLAELSHSSGALFHTDAIQALGKVRVDVGALGVDMASFSGHKFYALKGCGALYLRSGVELENLIHGGAQERARRAGTENTLAIASFGEVAKLAPSVLAMQKKVEAIRDRLEQKLSEEIQGIEFVGSQEPRVPNTTNIFFSDLKAQSLLMNLDIEGVEVSTGSACSSGSTDPSPVLLAMGMSPENANKCLRVSLGWGTTESEVDKFVEVLSTIVTRLRTI